MSAVPALTIAAYAALTLAIGALWFGRGAWIALSVAAIALGYASGVLAGPAALWLGLLAVLCLLYSRSLREPLSLSARLTRLATTLGIILLALGLGTHALPGFHNLRVADGLVLSPGAAPYTLYLNFDKAMVGLLLLGLIPRPLLRSGREWLAALRAALPLLLATVGVLVVASVALDYLHFDPRWHGLWWIWAPANLLFTCVSEEAFFRGFVQREAHRHLGSRRHAQGVAIAVSAITFGIAHLAGGFTYVALATLAGLGYALVYARTGRIEMAILTHFSLNAVHFLLFTYPRAAP